MHNHMGCDGQVRAQLREQEYNKVCKVPGIARAMQRYRRGENYMSKKRLSIASTLMLLMLAVVATFNITFFVASEYYSNRLGNFEEMETKYNRFKEVSDIVDKYYVGAASEEEMMDGALTGYIDGMGDEWSTYLNATDYKAVLEKRSRKYAGIGMNVSYDVTNKTFTVTSVTENSPAEKMGIKSMDMLLEIDGKPTSGMSYDTVTDNVRGDVGTQVTLKLLRDGAQVEITLTREMIKTVGVKAQMLEGNVGLIRIEQFQKNVDDEFKQKLNELLSAGATSMIFDVRFNPGGFIDVLVPMLDELLPEGTIISITDKNGKSTDYKSDASCVIMPMAVLTNEYSISAAEFFAASLQEYGTAKVVGDKTHGKGYAQTMIPLSDGAAVNISTSRYYTPKGVSLAGTGIVPEVEIALSPEKLKQFYSLTPEQDDQLQAAIEILKS